MQFLAIPGWGLLLVLVGGPMPFLATGPGCSSPPFSAGVCYWHWWVVPRHSWLWVLGEVPRYSWLLVCGTYFPCTGSLLGGR